MDQNEGLFPRGCRLCTITLSGYIEVSTEVTDFVLPSFSAILLVVLNGSFQVNWLKIIIIT